MSVIPIEDRIHLALFYIMFNTVLPVFTSRAFEIGGPSFGLLVMTLCVISSIGFFKFIYWQYARSTKGGIIHE